MDDMVFIGVLKKVDPVDGKSYFEINGLGEIFKKASKTMESILLFPSDYLPKAATGASSEDFLMFGKSGSKSKGKTSK